MRQLFTLILICFALNISSNANASLPQKNYRQEIVLLEKANIANPQDAISVYNNKKTIAFYYAQLNNYPKALETIEGMMIETPNNKELLKLAIEYSMMQKNWNKALFHTNKALFLEQTSEQFLKIQGDLYAINHNLPEAIKSYKRLVELYPKEEYSIILSELYQSTKDFAAAELIIKPVYTSNPTSSDLTQVYLSALLAQEKSQQAYSIIKQHQLERTKEGYRIMGDLALLKKDYKEAQNNYEKSLEMDSENIYLKLKLAQSYREQKKIVEAQKIYADILAKDPTNSDAKIGSGYLELDRKNYKKSRKIFGNILKENPENKNARIGISDSFIASGDSLSALNELDQIPSDEDIELSKSLIYYNLGMYSDADNMLKGFASKNIDDMRYKITKDRAFTIMPNYLIFAQQLADQFKLNINKAGLTITEPIGHNMKIFQEYNVYIYSSGQFEETKPGVLPPGKSNNVTQEIKFGTQGRINPKIEFRADLGSKFFQSNGAMLNTDSWLKYYFNDAFNLRLGFLRNNVEQSYVSAIGVPINGIFTGQVANNKVYLDYEARHPKDFYSYGRVSMGLMDGQNMPYNPYVEGMIGGGCFIYNNPDNKWIKFITADIVSYNASYQHNLLNIYDDDGDLYGGYYSPRFFTANTLNIKMEGDLNKPNLKYGLKGFAGGQVPTDSNTKMAIWGLAFYVSYNLNDRVSLNLGFNFFNFADVQKEQLIFNITIRGFKKNAKK